MSHLEALVDSNDVPELLLVRVVGVESRDVTSTDVLEGYLSFLQVLWKKLQGTTDGVSHRVGFWTHNAEGPEHKVDLVWDMKEGSDVRRNKHDETP